MREQFDQRLVRAPHHGIQQYEYFSLKILAIPTKSKFNAQSTYKTPRNLQMAKPTRKSVFLGKNMTAHFESHQFIARFVLTRDRNTTARHACVRDNYQAILKLLFEFQLNF